LIEDDPGVRGVVRMTLEDEGHTVIEATDGASALELARRHGPSLILLDMRLPGLNGWQFVASYRSQPGPHAPIVVLTAGRDAAGRAAEVGADGYLDKPFELDDLVAVVARYLS
jgi:CheY-like chemotaxis protein